MRLNLKQIKLNIALKASELLIKMLDKENGSSNFYSDAECEAALNSLMKEHSFSRIKGVDIPPVKFSIVKSNCANVHPSVKPIATEEAQQKLPIDIHPNFLQYLSYNSKSLNNLIRKIQDNTTLEAGVLTNSTLCIDSDEQANIIASFLCTIPSRGNTIKVNMHDLANLSLPAFIKILQVVDENHFNADLDFDKFNPDQQHEIIKTIILRKIKLKSINFMQLPYGSVRIIKEKGLLNEIENIEETLTKIGEEHLKLKKEMYDLTKELIKLTSEDHEYKVNINNRIKIIKEKATIGSISATYLSEIILERKTPFITLNYSALYNCNCLTFLNEFKMNGCLDNVEEVIFPKCFISNHEMEECIDNMISLKLQPKTLGYENSNDKNFADIGVDTIKKLGDAGFFKNLQYVAIPYKKANQNEEKEAFIPYLSNLNNYATLDARNLRSEDIKAHSALWAKFKHIEYFPQISHGNSEAIEYYFLRHIMRHSNIEDISFNLDNIKSKKSKELILKYTKTQQKV